MPWDRSHWMNFLENIAELEVVEYPVDEVRIIPHRLIKKLPILETVNIGMALLAPLVVIFKYCCNKESLIKLFDLDGSIFLT